MLNWTAFRHDTALVSIIAFCKHRLILCKFKFVTSETKESFVSKTCALLDGIILIGDASVIVTQDI